MLNKIIYLRHTKAWFITAAGVVSYEGRKSIPCIIDSTYNVLMFVFRDRQGCFENS